MPQKGSPIFQKVPSLLKISIFLAKMRKPIIPKLNALKKSSKLKKFKLLKHYNYGYIQEYEFSPSNTPLIHYHRKLFKKRGRRDIYSVLSLFNCLGKVRGERVDEKWELRALPSIGDGVRRELYELSDSCDEEDSVDEKAERFIERFYEEMRMQRKDSGLQLLDM